jgi:hypothetical protein
MEAVEASVAARRDGAIETTSLARTIITPGVCF